jgi:hypothetical protein
VSMLGAWLITIAACIAAEIVELYLAAGLIFDNPWGNGSTTPVRMTALEVYILPIGLVACLVGSKWRLGLWIATLITAILLGLGLLVTWQFWTAGWFTDGGFNLFVFPAPIVPGVALLVSTLAIWTARARRLSSTTE